jgi:hypothetical protein
MSVKQDRTSPRTPADLERRYNFGKSFAELRGIATDARTHATKAEELALKVQQQILDIDVVKELNVSAGTIILKSQGLSIESNGFSLSADKGIKTSRGNIGRWDISEEGISKFTKSSYVNMTAPEAEDGNVITVAKIEDGVVTATPFLLKANGEVFANAGQIGGWRISDGDLVAHEVTDDYQKSTIISPNNVLTYYKSADDERRVKLADGQLEIVRKGVESTVFATFTSGNKSYSLYVDVADNNRLKAYEL